MLKAIKPLAELKITSEQDERRVKNVTDKYENDHPRLGYLPVGALKEDLGMIMDMDTAEPLDVIKVDPW